MSDYGYYLHAGGYFFKFIDRNPEFGVKEFREYVVTHNRGDRDAGELGGIAKHEVLRLAHEFEEHKWRFPNVYGPHKE